MNFSDSSIFSHRFFQARTGAKKTFGALLPTCLLIWRLAFLVACSVLCLACPRPVDPGTALNSYIKETFSETKIVPVFLATNRAGTHRACSNREFLSVPGGNLAYGICGVQVPRDHAVASLDRAEGGSKKPDRYFAFQGFSVMDADELANELRASNGDRMLVFVHGFNVLFEEAVLRTAQIVYDLKFQGSAVLFTWPAGASSDGLLDQILINRTYESNRSFAAASVYHFVNFLRTIVKQKSKRYLVVHSMGHQVVIPGLLKLYDEGYRRIFDEIVFNAPDFAASDFRRAAERLQQMAGRVTLYCSPADNALAASQRINGNRRIGQCAKITGMDVINVHEIDDPALGVGGLGHGYYAGRAVLTDLFQTLLGVQVEKRLFIRKSNRSRNQDYYLRK